MAGKRLNVKFVIILSAIIVFFVATAFATLFVQNSRQVETYYRVGMEAFDQGNMEEARDKLSKIVDQLQEHDDQVEAIHKLALSYVPILDQLNRSTEDVQKCLGVMERALQLDSGELGEDVAVVKETCARCHEILRNQLKAAEIYEELAKEFGSQKPEYALHAAECYMNNKNAASKAESILLSLVTNHKNFIPGWIAFAKFYLEDNQEVIALQQLNTMVSENETATAYANRAIFLYLHPEMEEMALAEESALNALRLDTENPDALVAGVKMCIYRKQYDQAHEYLDKARKLAKNFPDKLRDQNLMNFGIELADAEGKPESALELLQNDVEKDPQNVTKHLQLFQRLIVLDKMEEAQKEINKLQEILPNNFPPNYLGFFEAMIDIRREKWAEAVRKLESARDIMLTQPEMLAYIDRQCALCYGRLGQVDKQFEMFQRAIQNANEEQRVPFYIAYIQALHAVGRVQQMEEVLLHLRDELGTDSFMSYHELRTLYFALRQQKEALKPADEQNWAELNKEMIAHNVDTNNPEGILLSVRMLVKQGKVADAKDLLRRAMVEHPNTIAFISYLALLEAQEKNYKEAISIIDTEYASRKDSPGLLVTKVRILSQMKSEDKDAQANVEKQLKDIEKIAYELQEAMKITLLKQLAMAWLQFENLEEADRLYIAIVSFEPENIGIKIQLFDLARKMDNVQKMNAQMERLNRELGPSSPEYLYCMATKKVWEYSKDSNHPEKLSSAKENLALAQKRRPTWVYIPRAQAEIAILEKDYDKAIECLNKVDEIGTLTTQQLNLLVRLLYLKNRDADVKALIQRKREANLAVDAAMMSVEALANSGDGDEAVRRGSEIIDPNNPKDYLWIGHIALRAKDYRKAEDAFRHVTEIAPENPNGWLSLLQVLKIQNTEVDQNEFISKIQAAVPQNKLPLCLAKAYQLFGDAREAEKTFQQAIGLEPNNLEVLFSISQFYMCTTHPELAIPYLKRMSSQITSDERLNPDTKNQQIAWTRRSLAQVYSGMADYDLITQGLQLVEENLSRQPDSMEDMKTKAILLAARHNPEDNQRAIDIFDTIPTPSNRELLVLGKLYFVQSFNPAAVSLKEKCQSVMNELVSSNENNVEYLTSFLDMMFSLNIAPDTISSYVDRLESVVGVAHPQVNLYRVRLMILSGKSPREIREWTEEHFPKSITSENCDFLKQAAIFLEKGDRADTAQFIWTNLTNAKVEFIPDYTLFIARQQGVTKALAYIQANETKIDPKAQLNLLCQVCNHSLDTVSSTEYKQMTEYVNVLFRDDPECLEMQMFKAKILELQGKFDEAINIYNALLEKPFTTAQIAGIENTLAYLLAMTRKDVARAVALIDEAVAKYPNDPNLLDSRAFVYMAAKERVKTDQAMVDLKHIIVNQNNAVYQFHIARLYLSKSNPNAAKIAFEEAKRLDPFLRQNITKLEVPDYAELTNNMEK